MSIYSLQWMQQKNKFINYLIKPSINILKPFERILVVILYDSNYIATMLLYWGQICTLIYNFQQSGLGMKNK